MEARMKLFGHPIHQMLIVFPLGLLITSWLADIGYWIVRGETFATVGYWNLVAGIIGGLAAAVFGFLDWLAIPRGTRAKAVGAWHGGLNVVVVVLFASSWFLRAPVENHAPTKLSFSIACVAIVFASVSSWLGGELVNRYTIGIKADADINAEGPFGKITKSKKSL